MPEGIVLVSFILVAVYTVTVVAWAMWPATRCRHDWKVLSKETTKSALEKLAERGISPNDGRVGAGTLMQLTKHAVIQILTCTKCGKLKKYTDYNHSY